MPRSIRYFVNINNRKIVQQAVNIFKNGCVLGLLKYKREEGHRQKTKLRKSAKKHKLQTVMVERAPYFV